MSEDFVQTDEYRTQVTRFQKVVRHIKNVQQNAEILAEKLIERGELDLARKLVAKTFLHDNSKLISPTEWKHLHPDEEFLQLAHAQHVKTNDHHPEFWEGGVNDMPEISIAEWVCDIKSRSGEFGTDVRKWLMETAPDVYDFSTKGKFYKSAKKYLDLLLEDPF